MKEKHDKYSMVPFPKTRQPVVDSLRQAKRMSAVHLLTEVDVTKPRRWIRGYKKKTGESWSFTAFLAGCVAKGVDEDKSLHAYRSGNKLVIFDEVDISIIIERDVDGEKAPIFPHVIRAANTKNTREIHDEIRKAQREGLDSSEMSKWVGRYWYLPTFVRNLMWRRLLGSPYWRKKVTGTVGISSIGMFGTGMVWGIPIPTYTLSITVGGIEEKPVVVGGTFASREYLGLTISFDHDIVDGAPATRFTQRLKELIESSYGLSNNQLT